MTNDSRVDALNQRVDRLEAEIAELRGNRDFLTAQVQGLAESFMRVLGACPECGQKVRDWKAPTGAFAPEAWATLREKGIDPATGHKSTCREARAKRD